MGEEGKKATLPQGLIQVESLRMLVLGLNAWTVMLLLPSALGGAPTVLTALGFVAVEILAVVPLALGYGAVRRTKRGAAWLLLTVYPCGLVMTASLIGRWATSDPYSTAALILSGVSLVAYGASAAVTCSRDVRLKEVTPRPLGAVPPTQGSTYRRFLRRTVLTAVALAGGGLILAAPFAGTDSSWSSAWGDGGAQARVLTIIVAGAATTLAVTFFVGPGLRATKAKPPTLRQRLLRVAGSLFAAAIFFVWWWAATG